jgi:hypothetical protein
VLLFAPTTNESEPQVELPPEYHWYEYVGEPPEGDAVRVTGVPGVTCDELGVGAGVLNIVLTVNEKLTEFWVTGMCEESTTTLFQVNTFPEVGELTTKELVVGDVAPGTVLNVLADVLL